MIRPYIKRLDGKPTEFNARNYMWGIKIHNQLRCFKAVLAQEIYEWRFKWTVGLMMAAPFTAGALMLDSPEARILLGLMAVIVLLVNVKFVPALHRRMELVGHMIEVVVAQRFYGEEHTAYAQSEANVMAGHYSQFKGWSPERILIGMLSHSRKAHSWVDTHTKWLTRYPDGTI